MLNPEKTCRLQFILLIAALTACAPLEWHQSGASPDSEGFAQEQDLMRRCMQNQGYILQTKPQSP
ncbi:MAG: hypothetical protein RLZZ445_75 [Pseudomonadota bacterium]|jgi:hypothetical protein